MRVSIIASIFTAFLSVFIYSPTPAIKFVPGTYQLQWCEDELSDSCWDVTHIDIYPSAPEAPGPARTSQSSRYCWGSNGKFAVIIDESKGTGAGYDILYLFQAPFTQDDLELSNSSYKILLTASIESDSITCLVSESSKTGANEKASTSAPDETKCPYQVKIQCRQDSDGADIPYIVEIKRTGIWRGTIKTDYGDIEVRTVDRNGNGTYNDMSAQQSTGDTVMISSSSKDYPVPVLLSHNILYLGQASLFDGRLYNIKVSENGDSITISEYQGKTGQLKLIAKDLNNKTVEWCQLSISGDAFYACLAPDSGFQTITLPVGDYDLSTLIWSGKHESENDNCVGILVTTMNRTSIQSDKTTGIQVGGRIRVEIEPGIEEITAKRGQEKYIQLVATVGSDWLSDLMGDCAITVNIRDENDKLLLSGQAHGGWNGAWTFPLNIPADWQPGKYKVCIGFDPRPYQDPIYIRKTLKIF